MILTVKVEYCTQAYFLLHLGMPGRDVVEESSSSSGYSPSEYSDPSEGFQKGQRYSACGPLNSHLEVVGRLILQLSSITPTRQIGLRDL